MNALPRFLPLAAALAIPPLAAAPFRVVETDARIEIHDGDRTVFGWQRTPVADPKGGDKFAASAFIHPLATPSGFGLTNVQPADHLHHFGVWWPWKHLKTGGKTYNCWELQSGEGRQVAVAAKVVRRSPDEVVILVDNRHEIRRDGAYHPVIREQSQLTFGRLDERAYQLDLRITQGPAGDGGAGVVVDAYRYSGFSWRGPAAWNRDNSVMRTSGGHDRDNANHRPARWAMVSGVTPEGRATMLILSGAPKDGGTPELLRVWGSNQHDGAPFVNFNPVARESLPLPDPAVARRTYRLVLADREILPEEADKLWKAWERPKPRSVSEE